MIKEGDVFQVYKDVYVPIQEYEDMLNYVAQEYGLPLSVNAIEEGAIDNYLSTFYKDAIENMTKSISNSRFVSNPNLRKNVLSEFQHKYLDVPKYLCTNYEGKFGYNQEVRGSIDLQAPNFINSLGIHFSGLDSSKRIVNYLPHLVYVENELDCQNNPLYVFKTNYSRKDGATHRINSDEPNVQSLGKSHRRNFLIPRKGYKFVQADISGQDPSVFFNGLCRDEDIIRGFYECGEYYLPVVSKISGNVPYDQIDKELRDSYKVGILSLMNGKTENNLAVEMGSKERARSLINFVESNPMYKRVLTQIDREIKLSQPIARSLVGDLYREIKDRGWHGKNQLRNSPIQMTGIALFCISMFEYFRVIREWYPKFKDMSLQEILKYTRPILHLHDEVLLETKDEDNLVELSAKALKYALCIKYEDWAPMKAVPVIGDKYSL